MDTTAITMCQATTKSGQSCRHTALSGSEFCWWHDPDKATDRREARARGGRSRHGRQIGVTGDGARVEINSLDDVLRLLEREINEVCRLERSNARGNTIARLATVAAAIYKDSELEARLARLEAQYE